MTTDNVMVFDTPEAITYAGLAGLKHNLRLESVGLKSRGGAIRPRIAKQLGLSPKAKHDVYIAEIQKRMDAILAAKAARELAAIPVSPVPQP